MCRPKTVRHFIDRDPEAHPAWDAGESTWRWAWRFIVNYVLGEPKFLAPS